jgi:hypothetical protein
VPEGSLSPELASEADGSGVEYVFTAKPDGMSTASVASWRLILRRFHPNHLYLSADIPPTFAFTLAASAQSELRGRVAVLVQADRRILQFVSASLRAATIPAAAYGRAVPAARPDQILRLDARTMRWCRDTFGLHAARVSCLARSDVDRREEPQETVMLVAGANAESDQLAPTVPPTLLALLLCPATLLVVAYASMHPDLEGLLTSLGGEATERVPATVSYVRRLPDWLACLDEAVLALGR